MKRLAILLLVALALAPVLWAGQVALAESGLTQKPPPPPPPDKEVKASPPPTPERVKPTALPTPLQAKPTIPPTPARAVPTAPPTPAEEPGEPAPTPTVAPTQPVDRERSIPPTAGVVSASRVITGRVFEDRNGNGVQDRDETGVAGVPVTLDGQVSAVTDPGGQFAVQTAASVWLAVMPPQGWQWSGRPWPADWPGPVIIPLRRADEQPAAVASAASNVLVGGLALVMIGLLALNLLAAWSQSAAVRSLERAYRRHTSQELELTMAREIADHRERLGKTLESDPNAWRALATQLFTDVGLGRVAPSIIQHVAVAPCPSLTIAGLDESLYVLTTDPDQLGQHGKVMSLDAGVSPFARVEAHTLWEHAMKRSSGRAAPLHDVAWYLVAPRQQRALLRPRQWNLRPFWKRAAWRT